jgi:hypothetical protein
MEGRSSENGLCGIESYGLRRDLRKQRRIRSEQAEGVLNARASQPRAKSSGRRASSGATLATLKFIESSSEKDDKVLLMPACRHKVNLSNRGRRSGSAILVMLYENYVAEKS